MINVTVRTVYTLNQMMFGMVRRVAISNFFFFNDTATTEIYTLSLHDALPIYGHQHVRGVHLLRRLELLRMVRVVLLDLRSRRSEEHTSELQSRSDLVCRLLLEKKKNKKHMYSSASS